MRLTVTTAEGVLHIEFEPAAAAPSAAEQPQRESQLDAYVEHAMPIGFRHEEPNPFPDKEDA